MTKRKLRAVFKQGPKVVGRAIGYGFNALKFHLKMLDLNLRDLNSIRYTDRELKRDLGEIGDALVSVLPSIVKLGDAAKDFKTDWTGKKPMQEGPFR